MSWIEACSQVTPITPETADFWWAGEELRTYQGQQPVPAAFIDYRCAEKKLASWEATLAPFDRSWLPLSENPDVHHQKSKPLSQEMHLKILHFSSGLKLSGAVEKLLFTYLWNIYPPTNSWHQFDSYRCNLYHLMPALTLVSLLEGYLVFETAMPRGDIRKRPSAHL
jgi:hypothetical protein